MNKLLKYKELINEKLKSYFSDKVKQAKKISVLDYDLAKNLADFTLRGGKRIRAILMILAYKAIKGKVDNEIIKASISMELIQSSLLVHDDIMDEDVTRRGGKTVHVYFSEYKKPKNNLFGESMAIIGGNILTAFTYDLISSCKFENNLKLDAINSITKYLVNVNYGQTLDVNASSDDRTSLEDVKKIHYYKTASYTAFMPIEAGALLAGANKRQVSLLLSYAKHLGLAFQLMDDTIGIFGVEKEIGKPVASDIEENKKTILVFKALEKCNKSDKEFIKKSLGHPVTDKDFKKIKKIIVASGSLDYSLNLAGKYIKEAINIIESSDFNNESKQEFIAIANYIMQKDKIKI